jgi:hypothetical protein
MFSPNASPTARRELTRHSLLIAALVFIVIGALCAAARVAPADSLFAAPFSVGTGASAISVAIGDLNGDASPNLAVANVASGTVSVPLNDIVTTPVGATAWPPCGVIISGAASRQLAPTSVSDGAGGAIVAWVDYRSDSVNPDIYAQHVSSAGVRAPGWPIDGLAVCTAPGIQYGAVIAPDGAGGAIIAWYDSRGGEAPFAYDIYAQRITAGGTIAAGWAANGVVVCDATDSQSLPTIVPNGSGGAIVVWADYRTGETDIYAQNLTASGTIAAGWPVNGTRLCGAATDQLEPISTSDGAGGAIATWSDPRKGAPNFSDIYAQRVLSSGAIAPGWPADGVALCTAIDNQLFPRIAPDGSGGAIVSWTDRRAGSDQVFAQRVSGSGAIPAGWPADGLAVCTIADGQARTRIISDGSGGAVVVWEDYRTGSNTNLYAQRITDAGSVVAGWPINGAAVCAEAHLQIGPVLVSDGSGGAVFAWRDDRNDPGGWGDLYAQRVTGTGVVAPGWPVDGIALCIAPGNQQTASIASDGSGGAIVAWEDERDSYATDLYATRVEASGYVTSVVDPPSAIGVGFLMLSPNPFRDHLGLDFALAEAGPAEVGVYDAAGRLVRRLQQGAVPAGGQHLSWDGRDEAGQSVAAGVYFVRVQAGTQGMAAKILRLK